MASIEIIVRDDDGNIINHKTQKSYDLGLGINRISLIEGALEEFKRDSLPEITYDILADAQSKEKGSIKKKTLSKCNGCSSVQIKTIHGEFSFPNQRFQEKIGKNPLDWLAYTEQFSGGYESERLRSRCCHYANIMSYNEVAELLEDETGVSLLSDQRIHAIIHDEAIKVSECNAKDAKLALATAKPLPAINKKVAIYDGSTKEVLLFNDGIQVKKQKENREKHSESPCNKVENSSQSKADKKGSRIQTDVIMLQKAGGGYIHLMEGIENKGDESVSLEELLTSTIITEYGNQKNPLNLVAITDGATSIRLYFERVFGFAIMLILDWYHLEKKIWDLMSMVSWNKLEKKMHCDILLKWLWTGQVDDALTYLKSITPRNQKKYDELITYLTKHKTEIINYQERKDAGKTIGSGRMEKGVEIVIGRRQKDNGMSWSEAGSKALGILKVNELNKRIKLPDSFLAA